MTQQIACVHCGQDWVREYQRKDTGRTFFLCPECESVWLDGQDLGEGTEMYLSEFMSTGSSAKDWETIEPVARGSARGAE